MVGRLRTESLVWITSIASDPHGRCLWPLEAGFCALRGMRPTAITTQVQRIERPDWHLDSPINREIADLVAPSYVDATALLERELAHNDLLYYIRDEDRRLVTFFMIARESVAVEGDLIPAIFLGLSATSQQTKGSGLYRTLFQAFIEDARTWQQALARPLLLWATTATPSSYHGARMMFDSLEPRPDGSCEAESATVANALRARYGLGPVDPPGNPFVMKGVASGTRYSPEEEARLAAICRKTGFDLFDRIGVDQRNGDRLLVTCRLPIGPRNGGSR